MPTKELTWINGNNWYCDAPSRFQGNPESIRAINISNPTQPAAPINIHSARWNHVAPIVVLHSSALLPSKPLPFCPLQTPLSSQTQIAGYNDAYALSATHPSAGPNGIPCHRYGISSSQRSDPR